jgi:hypothetical protein
MPDPARSRWIERRAGIGFTMSTQRRASREVSAISTYRAEFRRLTGPLMTIFWLAWAWLSTPATKTSRRGSRLRACDELSQTAVSGGKASNSLLLDHPYETLAGSGNRSGSAPPGRVSAGPPLGLRVSHRSSLRHVPNLLPVRAHRLTTLPIAPAGEVRWAERHDGKRDLYFQHAA